jgi:DNA-binding SARP family transcriptional activator/tetratricopeptide (TPR) repeat protein
MLARFLCRSLICGSGISMAVDFRLLGDIEIWAGERVIDVGPARRRYVLGVLLADANRVVPVGQLVERVWGERRLPANPAGALQTYISLLRQATGPAGNVTIARQAPGYKAIVSAETIDLHRFRNLIGRARAASDDDGTASALTEALGLWRGESFAGLDTPWANTIRATLALQRRAARLNLTEIQLRRGQHAALLTELADQASDHPLDEHVAGQLMLALYRSGRQSDALGHYEHTRRRLAQERGTDPGPPLRELHQRILTADATLAVPDQPAASISARTGRTVTPRQLPAPPGFFTGRAGELDRLTAMLDEQVPYGRLPAGPMADELEEPGGTVVISAIGGSGGIGKTWLALHWAHRHLGRFPDGQLWVNLRGFDPAGAPRPAAAAVRGFLDALGVDPEVVPPDPEAQIGLYRSLMAGKRMLVVLDNARDSSQVIPLLPGGSSCTVLITSRQRLTGLVTGHGARTLDLDVLAEDQARELLARYVGGRRLAAEPDAAAALLSGCAGLPLAISVVAARATAHPDFPLAVLAAELRETATRLDALETGDLTASVRAVLSCSYQALQAQPAAVFGQLGLAPGPDIGLSAAASLTLLSPERARAVLRELESASLVQEHVPGRYLMHDLVRLYAAEQASRDQGADARTATLRRVTDFYLRTAGAADRVLSPHATRRQGPGPDRARGEAVGRAPVPGPAPGPADEREAMAWFAAEHSCLLASQRLALAQGWHGQAWQLALALNTFHRRGGHFREWIETWQTGLTAAENLDRPAATSTALGFLGFACAHAGRPGEGFEHLSRALSLAGRAGDEYRQAHVHIFLCAAWSMREDHRQALHHATSALALFQALGDRVWEADALSSAGTCQAGLGQLGEARASCEAALALHRQHRFREGEARTLDSLGYIAHQAGHYSRALDYYAEALALHRDLGNTYRQPDAQAGLAAAHAARGEHDEARRAWQQALEQCHAQHRPAEAATIARQLDALAAAAHGG